MSTTKKITLVAASLFTAVGLAAGLAGCSSGGSSPPTATKTDTTAPSSTPTVTPSSTAIASTGAGGTGPVTACTTAELTGSIVAGSGGTAGSTYVYLALTNTGTSACTLQGWPGVSFVGSGNGTQIGAAAKSDRTSAHPTITVAADGNTKAVVQIVQAGNYHEATCSPVTADGLRVYPPGQKASLHIAYPSPACMAKNVDLLTVGAFH
jgi:hypothetical protein